MTERRPMIDSKLSGAEGRPFAAVRPDATTARRSNGHSSAARADRRILRDVADRGRRSGAEFALLFGAGPGETLDSEAGPTTSGWLARVSLSSLKLPGLDRKARGCTSGQSSPR
jgi:hypothetical protein